MQERTPIVRAGLFLYADVEPEASHGLPRRFALPLGSWAEATEYSPDHPPMDYVARQLARDDAEMYERLSAAIAASPQSAALYGVVLGEAARASAANRAAVRAVIERAGDGATQRSLIGSLASACPEPWVERMCLDAGPVTTIRFYRGLKDAGPFERMLGEQAQRAVLDAARALHASPDRSARYGEVGKACAVSHGLLEHIPGPECTALLADLERVLDDDDHALRGLRAVRDRRAAVAARSLPPWWPFDPDTSLDEQLEFAVLGEYVPTLLLGYPGREEKILEGLAKMASRGQEYLRLPALEALGQADIDAALQLIRERPSKREWKPLSAPWTRFGSRDALIAYLSALELLRPEPLPTFAALPRYLRHTRGHDLDALRALSPAIVAADPVLDAIPALPFSGEEEGEHDERLFGTVRLRAHFADRTYDVRCGMLSEGVAMGLLNTLSEHLGSDDRFLGVRDGDEERGLRIVCGPASSLERAVADGVLFAESYDW